MSTYNICGVTNQESNKFLNMSFLFALVVVFIHVPSVRTPGIVFLKDFLPGFLQSSANDWFFLAAGFFFVGHINTSGWWKYGVNKRLQSLVIPFLVINFMMCLMQFAYQGARFCYPVTEADAPVWRSVLCAMGLFPCMSPPVNGPSWFMRTLFLYVVSTPIIFPILKKTWLALTTLVILFVINIIGWDSLLSAVGIKGAGTFCSIYAPHHLLYFLLGVCLRFWGMPNIGRAKAFVLLIVGMFLSFYAPMDGVPKHSHFLYVLVQSISIPVILISLYALISTSPWPKVLTCNAFAIYILHWQLITIGHILCGKLGLFTSVFGNPFLWISYWLIVVLVTVCMAELLRKSVLLSKLVLGGR